MTDKAHALLSPSGASKWMVCAGSVAMCKDLPDEVTKYNAEGDAAHQLAAWCLTENKDAKAYLGRVIKAKGYEFEVDDEMADAVQVYVNRVREYAVLGHEFATEHTLLIEQPLPIGHVTGEEDAEGTGDAIILTDDEIQVHDLKFGQGVRVNAERNKQLMLYALGALARFGMLGDFKRVRLVIHQPRLQHLSEWDCAIEELQEFEDIARDRAVVAMFALGAPSLDTYLKPGDHCKDGFCKARATCPALAKFVADTVGADFEVLATAEVGGELLPARYSPEVLSAKMAATDLIEDFCRAVRAKVESELLAGNAVPGFKLVQGKRGARAWTDAEEVEKALKAMRLKQEQMYDFKLISPTTAEKLLKSTPKRWNRLAPLIGQSEGRPSVAPESDKRPALVLGKTEDDFEALV